MEALRKTREMRQKYEHLVDDSANQVSQSCKQIYNGPQL